MRGLSLGSRIGAGGGSSASSGASAIDGGPVGGEHLEAGGYSDIPDGCGCNEMAGYFVALGVPGGDLVDLDDLAGFGAPAVQFSALRGVLSHPRCQAICPDQG